MKQILSTLLSLVISAAGFVGCMTGLGTMTRLGTITSYSASYNLSLYKVERPEKATQRYGPQKVDTLSGNSKYRFFFEDNLVRILWLANSRNIAFSLENKTDHSIKIPWDGAAFVDEKGRSHRVMHSGVKYDDREKPQAPSIVVRKGTLEDIVFPTDYVRWQEGSRYTAGRWDEEPLLPDGGSHINHSPGPYPTLAKFESAVKSYVGKTYQVLLPLQIEGVINDYIFTFRVENVTAKQDSSFTL